RPGASALPLRSLDLVHPLVPLGQVASEALAVGARPLDRPGSAARRPLNRKRERRRVASLVSTDQPLLHASATRTSDKRERVLVAMARHPDHELQLVCK